jgi:hypothetical protein
LFDDGDRAAAAGLDAAIDRMRHVVAVLSSE